MPKQLTEHTLVPAFGIISPTGRGYYKAVGDGEKIGCVSSIPTVLVAFLGAKITSAKLFVYTYRLYCDSSASLSLLDVALEFRRSLVTSFLYIIRYYRYRFI